MPFLPRKTMPGPRREKALACIRRYVDEPELRQQLRDAGLRLAEIEALAKALERGHLTAREEKDFEGARRMFLLYRQRGAREVLATFRGDRRVVDEPEFPASGCYFDDRQAIHPGCLVNEDDLTRTEREALAFLASEQAAESVPA